MGKVYRLLCGFFVVFRDKGHDCARNKSLDLFLAQKAQNVPGTESAKCSWHRKQQNVPGTESAKCSWHRKRKMFLAQKAAIVPGTNTKLVLVNVHINTI
jgi:hypothetical protein